MLQEISAFTPGTTRPRVALLIDGDNISRSQAEAILSEAKREGDPLIRRVYGNAQSCSGWCSEPEVQMVHAGTGKNATDMLLCVQAMDIMLGSQADVLVIASSDGDFSHLATSLREKGYRVVGLGLSITALRFRASCSRFGVLEASVAEPPSKPKAPTNTALEEKALALIRAEGVSGSMTVQLFGSRMGTAQPKTKWRAWLDARPALFDCDPIDPQALVRLKT